MQEVTTEYRLDGPVVEETVNIISEGNAKWHLSFINKTTPIRTRNFGQNLWGQSQRIIQGFHQHKIYKLQNGVH